MPGGCEAMPPLALLAGGLATRLRPLTRNLPKSMVEVAGEPFIAHQLRLIVREGISEVVICCGYLGEQIAAFVGDGAGFGCRARYSWDGARPLGTGGALRGALPLLGESFFVMYGDSYLDIAYRPVWQEFRRCGRPALMTVLAVGARRRQSNAEFAGGLVRRYDKRRRDGGMRHVDYGLGVMTAAPLRDWPAAAFDLAEIYADLARHDRLAGYEVATRFYEIGSPEGLAETRALLAPRTGCG